MVPFPRLIVCEMSLGKETHPNMWFVAKSLAPWMGRAGAGTGCLMRCVERGDPWVEAHFGSVPGSSEGEGVSLNML